MASVSLSLGRRRGVAEGGGVEVRGWEHGGPVHLAHAGRRRRVAARRHEAARVEVGPGVCVCVVWVLWGVEYHDGVECGHLKEKNKCAWCM